MKNKQGHKYNPTIRETNNAGYLTVRFSRQTHKEQGQTPMNNTLIKRFDNYLLGKRYNLCK